MPERKKLLIYSEEDEIAFIEINRPERKNALNWECWQLFDEYFERLTSSNQIRALVITGHSEDLFSAGVDVTPTDKFIADMFQFLQNKDKDKLVQGFAYIQGVLSKLAHLPFPTEREKAAENVLSEQCLEGIGAFLEKRPPDWK